MPALLLAALLLPTFWATPYGSDAPATWISMETKYFQSILSKINQSGIQVVTQNQDITIAQVGEDQLALISEWSHKEQGSCPGFMTFSSQAEAMRNLDKQLREHAINHKAADYTINQAALVQRLESALEADQILDTIRFLSSFETRFYTSPQGVEAVEWLTSLWDSLVVDRDDVDIQLYHHASWNQPSAIITITGQTYPDEIVVIGGHVDSIFRSSRPEVHAPGADDNASGIATLTEVFRAMMATGYRPARTLQFMAYAAEEVGLRGALDIAQDWRNSGKNVIAVLQLDMTLYRGSDYAFTLTSDYTNQALNSFLGELIDTYIGLPWLFEDCGYACSDHAAWTSQGYPASFPFEAPNGTYNPHIHTPDDVMTLTKNDIQHAYQFARLSAAFAAELAEGEFSDPSLNYVHRLIYPWVSNSDQFESILIANNPDQSPAQVQFIARRENGDEEASRLFSLPGRGFLQLEASELFPNLGNGSGYAVELRADSKNISGRWVTNNLTAATGRSPSQGVAIAFPENQEDRSSRVGTRLLFSYLPISDQMFSAPVLVNMGGQEAKVSLYFYAANGTLLLEDHTTLDNLTPLKPFARLSNDLLSQHEDVYLIAESDGAAMTGVAFVFNAQGETAIGNATAIINHDEPTQLTYPWISSSDQFQSILVANNLTDRDAEISLTALRADGQGETVTRTIAAGGFLKEEASSLFPQLGKGSGMTVTLESSASDLYGSWVSNNLFSASGSSPSQGVAIRSSSDGDSGRMGNDLSFGFLPVSNGMTSGPVLVNLGEEATDVSLFIYNKKGSLLKRDDESLRNMVPHRPFATLINQLLPESQEDVYVVAHSPSQPITGVSFIFNSGNEPAIGNALSIAFNPETVAGTIENLKISDVGPNGDASDIRVIFAKPEHEAGVAAYAIMIVPAAEAASFSLDQANQVPETRQMRVTPTADNHYFQLDRTLTDSNGNAVRAGTAYQVFILSVADGELATVNALAQSSDSLILE